MATLKARPSPPSHYVSGLPYEQWHEESVCLQSSPGQVLSAENERQLFRQMNLAYFAAANLRESDGASNARSAREIRRLMQRADSIRDHLFQSFAKLNYAIAGRFTHDQQLFDELVSEGQVVMLRAMACFDPERGFRFSTYAMHAIRRRMQRYLRQRQRDRQLYTAVSEEPENDQSRRWSLEYEKWVRTASDTVERMLAELRPRERYVVRARYGWGQEFEPRTLREVAEELGVSRERVRQLETRALKKLRQLAAESHPEL